MKRIVFLMVLLAFSAGIMAQETVKEKKMKQKTELKKHVCTDACTADNHVFACGEVGHKCTDACKLKKHVCTDACKDGKHMYACGEKGHKCTECCKKKKQ